MIGTTVGGYQVQGLLAEGGMGAVWAAKHPMMGRDAVVKLLLPELSHNTEMVTRFFNEARAAASVNDPGIVQVFDVGIMPDGRAYIIMERLKGETLAARLRTRRPQHAADPLMGMRVEETINILRLIARTLDAAHARGIVHRDLKPDNIFLVPDRDVAGGERTKILDFGIAKLAGSGTQAQVTRAGSIFGTPAYMAPEQCSDAATVDARADLYAVGCIAYEMLAATPPFGYGGLEILASHMRDEPVPLRQRNPSVPPPLEAIVSRLLRKNPADRYASAAQLFEALDAVTLGGVAPTAYSVPPGHSNQLPHQLPVGSQQMGVAPTVGTAPPGYVPPHQTPPPGSMQPGSVPPPGSAPPFGAPVSAQPSWVPQGPTPPPQPAVTTYTAANGAVTTHPPPASKLPYLLAAVVAAAAAVVVVVVLSMNKKADPKPAPAVPTVAANRLADALTAQMDQRWDDAIAAAEQVTRPEDKQQAGEIAAKAREELKHQATFQAIERASAAKDLAGAQQAFTTIPKSSVYRPPAAELVRKLEEAARIAQAQVAEVKDPKKDPKKDPRKDPKKDPKKDPHVAVKDPVKPPDVRPPEEDPPPSGLGYDEAVSASHNALKREAYGEALRFAKAALVLRPRSGEARMYATIAACGMGQKGKALAFLPRDRGSYREVATSRCFKLNVPLE